MNTTTRMSKAEIIAAFEKASRDTWHNASLLHVPLEPVNSYEEEVFLDNCLQEYADVLMDSLRDMASAYGLDFSFAQYGRGGATIAPVEIAIEEHGRFVGFTLLGLEPVLRVYLPNGEEDTETEEILTAERVLEFLREMNATVRREAQRVSELWAEDLAALRAEKEREAEEKTSFNKRVQELEELVRSQSALLTKQSAKIAELEARLSAEGSEDER